MVILIMTQVADYRIRCVTKDMNPVASDVARSIISQGIVGSFKRVDISPVASGANNDLQVLTTDTTIAKSISGTPALNTVLLFPSTVGGLPVRSGISYELSVNIGTPGNLGIATTNTNTEIWKNAVGATSVFNTTANVLTGNGILRLQSANPALYTTTTPFVTAATNAVAAGIGVVWIVLEGNLLL